MKALVGTTSLLGVALATLFLFGTLAVAPVHAQATINADTTGLTATGTAAYGPGELLSLPELIGRIISIGIYLSGLVVFLILIYGGFIWMTAQGDTDKVDKAQKMISAAVVGLAILLSAYAITAFVVSELVTATGV